MMSKCKYCGHFRVHDDPCFCDGTLRARIRELEGRLDTIADAALAIEKQIADTPWYIISKGKVLSAMQHIRKIAAMRGGEGEEK